MSDRGQSVRIQQADISSIYTSFWKCTRFSEIAENWIFAHFREFREKVTFLWGVVEREKKIRGELGT